MKISDVSFCRATMSFINGSVTRRMACGTTT